MTVDEHDLAIAPKGMTLETLEAWCERFHSGVWPILESLEGGFANSKTDSGGPTNYGVTHRTLKDINRKCPEWCRVRGIPYLEDGAGEEESIRAVRQLTPEKAEQIAFMFYYVRPRIGMLKAPFDLACLDWRYNGGPAIDRLQFTAGIQHGPKRDGIIGPFTAERVAKLVMYDIGRYMNLRFTYLRSLHGRQGWEANGEGWTVRINRLQKECESQMKERAKYSPLPTATALVGTALPIDC